MDKVEDELEELESIFSDHFGRTPLNTPACSQNSDEDSDSNCDENEGIPQNDVIEGQVRDFLTQSSERQIDSESEEECVSADFDPGKVATFYKDGCGCSKNCHLHVCQERLVSNRLVLAELTKEEKDLRIMSALQMKSTGDRDITTKGKKRQRVANTYFVEGHLVCKKTFMLFYDIGRYALAALTQHVRSNGVTFRTHGNKGKTPKHAVRYDDVIRVVRFLENYSEENGIPQPAAPRGIDNIPSIYLPCSVTKAGLYSDYKRSCGLERVLGLSSFKDIWRSCIPHIRIDKPREDVCGRCEKHRHAISDAVTEDEKLESLRAMETHINLAKTERDFYNDCVRKSVQSRDSADRFVHLTFDFSQNVSVPHYARQPGPLYFLSLRKIQIFGVRFDGLPKQLNFLIDEDQTIGEDGKSTHGPDAVISMLDWSLQQYGTGEASCSIHADNCSGQNKNRYLLGYFMWRVMTKQHDTIEYHMQIPGHARCLVDSSFAHIKIRYRSNDCETLEDVAAVVERSSHINTPVVYPQWCWRRWKPFLEEHFKSFPGIRQYQHFRFTSEKPGVVIVSGKGGQHHARSGIPVYRHSAPYSCACGRIIGTTPLLSTTGRFITRSSSQQKLLSVTFHIIYTMYIKKSASNTKLI